PAESAAGVGAPLGGTHWILAELEGVAVELGAGENAPHLVLDGESSRLSGSGGCNRLVGSYEVGDDGLRFGQIASTRMACSDAVMEREAAFLAALGAVTGHRLDGSSLLLLDGDRVRARLTSAAAEIS
ncbi:MAG TPA: META domain-containing protein, partial [Gaiellaceae bacterium]|nr:META domain-containing protein [Gaiellaceae bacterium]